MKKALVIGGSGFLGSHVADALHAQGYDTTIFDLADSPYLSSGQKFIQGSILDPSSVEAAIKGMDIVFHLAGQPDIARSVEDPTHTLNLNIQGTVNILEACRKHKVKRFMFASTIYVYSDVGAFYRASKQSCEIIVQEYQKQFGLDYTILRYGSLYGPRAPESNFIHRILKQALLEKKVDVGDYSLEDRREYIHVVDSAKMSLLALGDEYVNSSVMLTGYQFTTCRELFDLINDIMGGGITFSGKDLENKGGPGRYHKTPYVFRPQISRKIIASDYIEFGQGILASIEEIHSTTHPMKD